MSADQLPPQPPAGIHDLNLETELKESYLTYAMSVLVDRALPDIRDGLKPVHRRILQTMRDLNLSPGAKYQKAAKIVGHCLGNYHPHGDTSVYDAMVRMAQDFSLRYELVDGQGNFGSIDGDAPAAYRYTEARMTKLAGDMLEDIHFDTVDFKPNYNNETEEPTVLPGKLPNLLVNGSSGIAVGMATNIPPHNLKEVCGAIIHLIDHPDTDVAGLMQFIRGPDFPTAATICGTAGIREAYATGHGRVIMRATTHREEIEGRDAIIVTQIPYGVKLGTITESIQDADRDERIKGLHKMYGGVVGNGIRLVIELKKGEDADLILNQLWEHTYLQSTFAINMVALDGGRPRTVNLKRMCQAYIEHRQEVIVRRTRFLLARDLARLHLVEGLLKAIDLIDAIVALIRAADSVEVAKGQLIERFGFSPIQAQAILDMPLRRLTGLEKNKLTAEAGELNTIISDYRDILNRSERQFAIITADLTEMMEKHGDERRSEIVAAAGDFRMEDLVPDAPSVVVMTLGGYIKRMPVDTFRIQRRGGKGVSGGQLKEDDQIARVLSTSNHQHLLVFTDIGKVHWLRVWDIPEAERTARGKHLANVLALEKNEAGVQEKVCALHAVRDFPEDQFLVFLTRLGQIKKTALAAYGNPRNGGIKAVKLAADDALIDVVVTTGADELLLAADDGKACRWHEGECRATARDTGGVCGIDLNPGAAAISLVRLEPGSEVLTICRNGFGKRTPFSEYRLASRGGKGVINIDTSDRNGAVVASLSVKPGDGLLLITVKGQVVRTTVDSIRSVGRTSAGVTIIDLDPGDAVLAIDILPPSANDGESDGESNGAAPGSEPAPTPV